METNKYPYVQNVLSRLSNLKTDVGGWIASCPAEGHGTDGKDSSPSLWISVGDQGIILLHCRVGCCFWDIIKGLELEPYNLRPNPYLMEEPHPSTVNYLKEEVEIQNSDMELLFDNVYRSFLLSLPLEKEHSLLLLRRGINKVNQQQRGYRTLNEKVSTPAIKLLYKTFGDDIFQVPGFVADGSSPKLKDNISGILIPVLNKNNRIIALKVRRDGNVNPRYLYITSHPIGRSPGAPVHCPTPILGEDYKKIRITEGELKADISTLLSDRYTIGIPGVSNWWKVVALCDEWKTEEVLLSLDWKDVQFKKPITDILFQLYQALSSKNIHVGIEVWNPIYKGIDDALEAKDETIAEIWDDVESFILSQPSYKEYNKKKDNWIPAEFPVDIFPTPIQTYINTVAKSLPCPVDFLAVPLLVAASACIGRSKIIRIKDSWEEQCNLWASIVALPGSMKTPAVLKIMKPLKKIQKEKIEEHSLDLQKWEDEKKVYAARKAVYQAELRKFFHVFPHKTADDPTAPTLAMKLRPEPSEEKMLTDDITLEGLAVALLSSPRGVLRETDEFLAIFRSFGAYRGGRGGDRQGYLSLWSGASIKVDRKGSKSSLFVEHPFFSLLGGIQPDRLRELEDESGAQDGMLDRILFSMPIVDQVSTLRFDVDVDSACEDIWEITARSLRLNSFQEDGSSTVVHLSEEAKKCLEEWHQRHLEETQVPGFPKFLLGPWSKFKAYIMRFALILHCIREAVWNSGLDISTEKPLEVIEKIDIETAEKLLNYFKNHYRGVQEKLQFDRDDSLIEDFVNWLKDQGGKVSSKDLVGKTRWKLKGRSSVDKFLAKVQDRGFGMCIADACNGKPGRTQKVFVLGIENEY